MGLDLPQKVFPAQVLGCTVDKPSTCKWGDKYEFTDFMETLTEISARPGD